MLARTPLAVAFSLALQGCWGNCGGMNTQIYNLTELQVRLILGSQQAGEDLMFFLESADTATLPQFEGELDYDTIDCAPLCQSQWGGLPESCSATEVAGGLAAEVHCTFDNFCGGRYHAVVQTASRASGDTHVARRLAQMAHDERASVHAFLALAEELQRVGAPEALRLRVLDAARDEVRHGRVIGALANARGGVVPRVDLVPIPERALEAIALENAVEATVNETWAAMQAWFQAHHAQDPEIREAMRTIATDETRHAELGRDLHDWFCSQLTPEAVQRIETARDAAIRSLLSRQPAEADAALGLPSRAQAQTLIATLRATVWQ